MLEGMHIQEKRKKYLVEYYKYLGKNIGEIIENLGSAWEEISGAFFRSENRSKMRKLCPQKIERIIRL